MKLPHKTLERKLFQGGYTHIIGVDEVGMACLAGPVYVCAVLFTPDFFSAKGGSASGGKKAHKKLRRLRDSKLLLPHQREKFFNELIKEKDIKFEIASSSPKTIDRINIYQAARLAMRRAVKKLTGKSAIPPTLDPRLFAREFSSRCMADLPKVIVLVDGKTKIQGPPLDQMDQKAIVKGDQKVFAIACASIIAKVTRDRVMTKYAKKFPNYGFEKHKGYPTKEHKAQLAKFGVCPIHRKSFKPVANLI